MSDERIIAIETSSRRGSIAWADGPTLLGTEEFAAERRHAADLLPAIARGCRTAGWTPDSIRQVHLSIGPGSFTGLRIAVTTARHLSLAVGARIVAVPSLAVIAENALDLAEPPPRVAVVLDAKRNQVYAGLFERRVDRYESAAAPVLVEPGAWLSGQAPPVAVMGEGVAYHRAAIEQTGVHIIDESRYPPRAEAVHRLGWRMASAGQFTPPAELVPHYVRRPEAEELWEKRQPAKR